MHVQLATVGGRSDGGLFWSVVPALLVVLFWGWAGLLLLQAQRSRPPPPLLVNRYLPFFGFVAWLRACPPLDAAMLSQAAALVLRLPLAWPQATRPLQAVASVLLLDVAAWTPCGGWAGLATDSWVSAGALFGGAWSGRFGDVVAEWFGEAADSEDTTLMRQDGQLDSAFAGTLRAHSVLLSLLLVLPPWALRLSFTHARRSLPSALQSRKKRPAKSWFSLTGGFQWVFCCRSSDNNCALLCAGCGAACSYGCSSTGCVCACGDPSDHRGRTSRVAAGNARAVLYAGVLARLLLPVSLLRLVEAAACVNSSGSSWALADPEELTCGSARHKGLILEASLGLVVLVVLQLHSGLPTLLYRHRRTPCAPPHAWHLLRQAFSWGLGSKLTEDMLGAKAPGAKSGALQNYREGNVVVRCSRHVSDGVGACVRSYRVLDWCWRRVLAPVLGVLYRSFLELFWSADTTPPLLALAALCAASAASPLALANPAAATAAATVVVLASLGSIPLIADRGLTSSTDAVPAAFAATVAAAAAFCGARFLPAAVAAASVNDDNSASRLSNSGLPWRARVDAGTPEPYGMGPWLDLVAVVVMAFALIAPVLSVSLSCWHCSEAAAQRKRVHQAATKAHAALQASYVARGTQKSLPRGASSHNGGLSLAGATTGPLAQLQHAEASAMSAKKHNLVTLEVDLKQLETFASSDALLLAVSSAKSNRNRSSIGSSGEGLLTPAERAAALLAHATLSKGARKVFLKVNVDVRIPPEEGSVDSATGLPSSPVVHRREVAFVTTRNDTKATHARSQAGTGPSGRSVGVGDGGSSDEDNNGDRDNDLGGSQSGTWSWVPLATLEGGTLAPWVVEVPSHAKGRATVHVTVSTRSGNRLALWDGILPADKLLHRSTANGDPSAPPLDALQLYSPSTAKAVQQQQQQQQQQEEGAVGASSDVLAHPWTLKLVVGYTDPAASLEAAAEEQAKDAEAAAIAGASSLALLNASWSDVAPEDAAWALARGLECIDFAASSSGSGVVAASATGSQALCRVLLLGAEEASKTAKEEDAKVGTQWSDHNTSEEKRSDESPSSPSPYGPVGASRGRAGDVHEESLSSSSSTLTPARRAERLVQLLLSLGSHRDALQRRKDGAVRQAMLEQQALGIWDEEEEEDEDDDDGHGIGSSGIPAAQRSAARAAALFAASEECDDVGDDRDGDYCRFLSRLVELYPGTVASLASSRFSPPERALLATVLSRFKLRLKRRTHELPSRSRSRRHRRQPSRRVPRHGGGRSSGAEDDDDDDDDDNDGAGGDTSSEEEHEADLAAAGLSSLGEFDGEGYSASASGHHDELRVAGRAVWPSVLPSARGALAATLLSSPEDDAEDGTAGSSSTSHRQASGAPAGRVAAFVALRQVATANWAR